jgi:hypothetical protein
MALVLPQNEIVFVESTIKIERGIGERIHLDSGTQNQG